MRGIVGCAARTTSTNRNVSSTFSRHGHVLEVQSLTLDRAATSFRVVSRNSERFETGEGIQS